jgi:hypothetical protein
MSTSCGEVVIPTMKDGWTHALDDGPPVPGPPSRRWSYPSATIPFTPADGTSHDDTRYMRGGAAWGDVYVAMNGGLNLTTSGMHGLRLRVRSSGVPTCAEGDGDGKDGDAAVIAGRPQFVGGSK